MITETKNTHDQKIAEAKAMIRDLDDLVLSLVEELEEYGINAGINSKIAKTAVRYYKCFGEKIN